MGFSNVYLNRDVNEKSIIMQISSFQTFWFQVYFIFLKMTEEPKDLCSCDFCPLTLSDKQLQLINRWNIYLSLWKKIILMIC